MQCIDYYVLQCHVFIYIESIVDSCIAKMLVVHFELLIHFYILLLTY